MLQAVDWPDLSRSYRLAGWEFDHHVASVDVLRLAGQLPEPPGVERGSARWTEWMLGRVSATQAAVRAGVVDPVIATSTSGAPFLIGSDVGVSIAHTPGIAVAVAGPSAIGVDVERIDRDVSRLVRALGPGERDIAFSTGVIGALVAKEAVAKATGMGLGGSLARWPLLDAELSGPHPILHVATPDERILAAQLIPWKDFVVGVALSPRA